MTVSQTLIDGTKKHISEHDFWDSTLYGLEIAIVVIVVLSGVAAGLSKSEALKKGLAITAAALTLLAQTLLIEENRQFHHRAAAQESAWLADMEKPENNTADETTMKLQIDSCERGGNLTCGSQPAIWIKK